MAVKLGVPLLIKEDSTARRYFCKPLRVYKGTQSAVAVNWSGAHSTRRPSLLRIGNQWLVITSGRSDLDTAARGTKKPEVSMSLLEGVVPASSPRRLHLMCWTQSLPLWVELLHEEACSPPFLLSCPPRVASGSRLVQLLV